jgi:hypothetical protein
MDVPLKPELKQFIAGFIIKGEVSIHGEADGTAE